MLVFGVIFENKRQKSFMSCQEGSISIWSICWSRIYLYLYLCLSWATLFHQRSIRSLLSLAKAKQGNEWIKVIWDFSLREHWQCPQQNHLVLKNTLQQTSNGSPSFYSLFIAFIEVISAYNYCYHVYLYLLVDHLYDCSIKSNTMCAETLSVH